MPINQCWQTVFNNVTFGIIHQHGRIPAPINARDDGAVIGKKLGKKRDEEQHSENDQRPIAALIGTEILKPSLRKRGEHQRRASKSMRGSTSV